MKIVVLKIGGKELNDTDSLINFVCTVKDIKEFSENFRCVIVHGGGNLIDIRLTELNIKPKYYNGIRVTDEETMKVVEDVLCGVARSTLLDAFKKHAGMSPIAFPRSSHQLIMAKKTLDNALGFVGEIESIDVDFIKPLLEEYIISIFAPIAKDEETGGSLNVNADVFASKLASALNAEILALISDVLGIYDESENVISSLTVKEAKRLMKSHVIKSGMLPKLSSCVAAVEGGVKRAYIMNSKTLSAKLNDVLTGKPCGTMFHAGK